MPIYEYACTKCGHELEALQKISEPPLTQCPACHADALVKQVSAAGFQLKGSGWYVTDFRDGGSKKKPTKSDDAKSTDAKAGAENAAPTETASEGKASATETKDTKNESKPAAKPVAEGPPSS